eukprot:Sspe_Gene.72105::Locus_42922_Transcript_1_1_Confidence_1.000_Length_1283::g.72105::m.72105/K20783/RRA; arabinosyltransferase
MAANMQSRGCCLVVVALLVSLLWSVPLPVGEVGGMRVGSEGEVDPFVGPPRCPLPQRIPPPRPLEWVVPPDGPSWPNPGACKEDRLVSLCGLVERVAVQRQVMVTVANHKAPGLRTFIDTVKNRVGMQNFMVVALDTEVARVLTDEGVPHWIRPSTADGNHKISAEKFAIIADFLRVGVSVLLTDTDVAYFQNPFPYLSNTHDIEVMSDGWDSESAYGMLDQVSFRMQALNSGLWYAAATNASLRLMDIMGYRMRMEDTWDQAAFNMEAVFPSRDAHLTSGATVRVLSPLCFMNSK